MTAPSSFSFSCSEEFPTFPTAAGWENNLQKQKDIKIRFYDKLFHLIQNQDLNQKVKEFFTMKNQMKLIDSKEPDAQEPEKADKQEIKEENNSLLEYDYFIYLFYILLYTKKENEFFGQSQNELWLKYKSCMVKVNIDENSGCIYQSPYDRNLGMVYIGKSNKDGIFWFITEDKNGIDFLNQYYMSRAIPPVLWCNNSLIPKIKSSSIPEFKLTNPIVKQILNGNLSDAEIKCRDQTVKISKCLLSLHSEYFFTLFKLENKSLYSMDNFSEDIMIYYMDFCANQNNFCKYFNPSLITEFMNFADFIQDKLFIEHLYNQTYHNSYTFDQKSLIQILKNFKVMGFDFLEKT
jgi:hypothetical protein